MLTRVQRPVVRSVWPALLVAVLAAACSDTAARERVLTVVCTTDRHGHAAAHAAPNAGGRPLGGLATFAAYLEALRAANPDGVLFLDAGDMWTGTLLSDSGEGAAIVEVYNALGCEAAAVGNHEFDYGPAGPAPTAAGPDDDPLGALKARAAQARFPLLLANAFTRDGGRPVTAPNLQAHTLVQRAGSKIGIVGVTTPHTAHATHPANVRHLRFGDPVPAVRNAARALRAQGAQVIVVLAHMGAHWDAREGRYEGEAADLARALGPAAHGADGIDVICAGHSHGRLDTMIGGVAVVQADAHGRAFARVDLPLDPRTGRVRRQEMAIHPPTRLELVDPLAPPERPTPARYLGRSIRPTPAIDALVDRLSIPSRDRARRTVGTAAAPFPRLGRPGSPLGNLITDAMRGYTPGVDLAVTNSGSIRDDLDAGPITYGELYRILPFNNQLVTLTLTGEQIHEVFERSASGERGILELSGAVVTLDPSAPGGGRIQSVTRIDGRPFAPKQRYRVAIHDFLLAGGDGYRVFKQGRDVMRHPVDLREVVVAHLTGLTHPATPDGTRRYVLAPRRAGGEEATTPSRPLPPDLY